MNALYLDECAIQTAAIFPSLLGPSFSVSQLFWFFVFFLKHFCLFTIPFSRAHECFITQLVPSPLIHSPVEINRNKPVINLESGSTFVRPSSVNRGKQPQKPRTLPAEGTLQRDPQQDAPSAKRASFPYWESVNESHAAAWDGSHSRSTTFHCS